MYSRQSTCHQVRLLVSHTEHQTPTGAHASSKGNGGFAACVLAELSAPCLAPSVWAQDGTVEKTVGTPILPGLLLLPALTSIPCLVTHCADLTSGVPAVAQLCWNLCKRTRESHMCSLRPPAKSSPETVGLLVMPWRSTWAASLGFRLASLSV